ncbi:hypothetical protein [Naasia lichenicola]|uniref:Uncharacterized protein n=1 Tax=Naasia lichenicola TaxID=2565933 RepID=A0A4S4FNB9_9MICO|nr:hypothetical protein [Naasia lichenicola]THG30756.1 hypothetical protein E6C64_08950 [Naasia lichenicola]THG31993.1 hypothetical protein E6C64_08095 [Naasia lichenicola]
MTVDRVVRSGDNPFQAALLSVAVVLIAIGVITFGVAASKAAPSPLYPDAAADALPSLIWGGAIIGIGAISFLFWLLVSALKWNGRTADPRVAVLVESPHLTEAA